MAKDDNRIKVGDVVYLKSGSPRLTVIEINGEADGTGWIRAFGMKYESQQTMDIQLPAICFLKTEVYGGPSR